MDGMIRTVESYDAMLNYLAYRAPIIRRLFESILAEARRQLGELARKRQQMLLASRGKCGAEA
jgi:hypothetical protein